LKQLVALLCGEQKNDREVALIPEMGPFSWTAAAERAALPHAATPLWF
jgi:hypothetical protein